MRILYVTTVGGTMRFFTTLIEKLLADGHTVDIATNEQGGKTPVPSCYRQWGCRVYQLSCTRSPFNRGTGAGVREIRGIVDQGNYDIVHCHTPVAAACTRLACRKLRRRGLRVFYTAHGFHFYDGAPLINWLIYYPVEKALARYTDVLITINQEDYRRAQRKLHAGRVVYVPGVGVDISKFCSQHNGARIRDEFGIGDSFLLLSVGELNKNKNHEVVIRAIADTDVSYMIVGQGAFEEHLRRVSEDVGARVFFAGHRSDVEDFYDGADAYVLPSLREGLNLSLMEAMASGLPCVAGNIRGNTDLIDARCGMLFDPTSAESARDAILALRKGDSKAMAARSLEIIKHFSSERIDAIMISKIYGQEEEPC